MADRIFRPKTVYLVRSQSGASEDFWPCSAHWTWSGAVQGLKEKADEWEIDYSKVTFPQSPSDPNAELFCLGDVFFIQQMEVD